MKLKPCPFCGPQKESNKNPRTNPPGFFKATVTCPVCLVQQNGETLEEAIEAWNTREDSNA